MDTVYIIKKVEVVRTVGNQRKPDRQSPDNLFSYYSNMTRGNTEKYTEGLAYNSQALPRNQLHNFSQSKFATSGKDGILIDYLAKQKTH